MLLWKALSSLFSDLLLKFAARIQMTGFKVPQNDKKWFHMISGKILGGKSQGQRLPRRRTAAARASFTSRNCRCSSTTTWQRSDMLHSTHLNMLPYGVGCWLRMGQDQVFTATLVRLFLYAEHSSLSRFWADSELSVCCFYLFLWCFLLCLSTFSRFETSLILELTAVSAKARSRSNLVRLPWRSGARQDQQISNLGQSTVWYRTVSIYCTYINICECACIHT